MPHLRGIHWFAPSAMVGSLLAGVLLAVGHHLFYQGLDGSAASTVSILGSDLSRQQASIAIGTALAFLVKACLVYAITVAYVQVFWKEAKARNAAPTLSTLDDIASGIDNLLVLFKLPLWLSYYLLLLLALVAWLVPIASIITPATLSSELAPVRPAHTEQRFVPNLDFRSLAFYQELRPTFPSVYVYSGPSHPVSNIAGAAMANGAILPIPPLASNSTWEVDFFGPSIKCNPVNETLHLQIRQDMFRYLTGFNATIGRNYTLYGYMAWFPELGYFSSGVIDNVLARSSPFHTNGSDDVTFETGPLYNTFYMFAASHTLAETYFSTVTGSKTWDTDLHGSTLPDWLDGTILECTLLNSSYHVRFNYTEGLQQVNVQSSLVDPQTPIDVHYSVYGPGFGANFSTYHSCLKLSFSLDDAGACVFDSSVLSTLSYQAVWDAFTTVLKGSVYHTLPLLRTRDSSIVDTALANLPQLFMLRGVEGLPSSPGVTLQNALAAYDSPLVHGLNNSYDATWDLSLGTALEEMFGNVTVSLMSSPALRPSNQSASAPGAVNVTFPAVRLVYSYSPWKLWLSYGIAILFTLAAVAVGLVTLAQNKASYSDDFSTIFRTARGAELSVKIKSEDLPGYDPLPEYLEKAWVTMRNGVASTNQQGYQLVALNAPSNVPPPQNAQGAGTAHTGSPPPSVQHVQSGSQGPSGAAPAQQNAQSASGNSDGSTTPSAQAAQHTNRGANSSAVLPSPSHQRPNDAPNSGVPPATGLAQRTNAGSSSSVRRSST